MNITISNEKLSVSISKLGAELRSLKDAQGTEYLWDGNPAYWTGRAPNLFPYIGRLTEKTYKLNGVPYHMEIHGFAAKKRFSVQKTPKGAVFRISDDASTRRIYPFLFDLSIEYRLEDACLKITYTVKNRDKHNMYFGIGGHPGFKLPFEKGLGFEDYYLDFDKTDVPVRIGFGDTCFRNGDDTPFPLSNGRLQLKHSMFDKDAIVLREAACSVVLKSDKGKKAVRVVYPGMPYIGFWHMPKTEAPYICIEPWSSLPSREGIVEEISKQEDLIKLPAGETYRNEWSIRIIEDTGDM